MPSAQGRMGFLWGVFLFPQFTDIGTFETVWQVKFYNYHKRDHCQWGSPFSVIEYECKPNETRSLMWVNKESFLWRWLFLMFLDDRFRNLFLDNPAQAFTKAHHTVAVSRRCQWPTSPDYSESVIPLWCNVPDKRTWCTIPRRSLSVFCAGSLHPIVLGPAVGRLRGPPWNWQASPIFHGSTEWLWCFVSKLSDSPFLLAFT